MNSCTRKFSLCPVRPNGIDADPDDLHCVPCGDLGWESAQQSHIEPATGEKALVDGDVIDMDDDEVVQAAVPMPAPIMPSQAQVDAHNLTLAMPELVSTLCRRSEAECSTLWL